MTSLGGLSVLTVGPVVDVGLIVTLGPGRCAGDVTERTGHDALCSKSHSSKGAAVRKKLKNCLFVCLFVCCFMLWQQYFRYILAVI